jgi:predicted AAA+ superfamily ATPase
MVAAAGSYRRRLADSRLAELTAAFPAVLINGPRAAGKSTTARKQAATVVRLDREAEAAVFRADPDAALRTQPTPVLLDEWQQVPGVLGAVKRAVDGDRTPGRYILTGSVNAQVEQAMWPGTGRIIRLSMYGLTELEILDSVDTERQGFLDRLAMSDASALRLPADRPDLPGYIDLAVRGGFPEMVLGSLSQVQGETWLNSYLEQLLSRDVLSAAPNRDPGKMRQYFRALALSTAGTPQEKTLADSAKVNFRTARTYDRLFADLFIAEEVPAWASNRLARLVPAPKRYIVDAALAARAANLSAAGILRDGDQLGRILDTFVMAQLRPEVALSGGQHNLHHLRTKAGLQEVDLVVELSDNRVLALEFKATASPSLNDARHLVWLRDHLGDRFVAGAVMHTGPAVFGLSDRIVAAPICTIWG